MSNPIRRASDALGGQAALARALGVSPPTVNQWANGERPTPDDRCRQIEFATSGAVTVEELSPGVLWTRIPDPDWPHPDGRPLLDFAPDRPTAQEGV